MKKIYFNSFKNIDSNSISYKNNSIFLKIISQNLQKYKTTKKQYEIYITNSIIYDQKNHKVAVFKDYLLWDENSEFLKRFYKSKEIKDRLPKISEYYEKYTLFAPIYFGFEGLVILIMNKWTKRKKNYLEYVEDHEYDSSVKSNKKENFEPIIKSSLINDESGTKSVISKTTIELNKSDVESTAKNKNNNKDFFKSLISNKEFIIKKIDQNENNKIKKLEEIDKKNSVSFSEIFDDLSSNYSVFDNICRKNKEKENNKNNKNIKLIPKKENFIVHNTANNSKIKDSFSNKNNKANTFFSNCTDNKSNTIRNISKKRHIIGGSIPSCSNSRQKRVGLIKKKKIFKFNTNNDQNIIQRNNDLLPNEKKINYRILNTDCLSLKNKEISCSNLIFNSVYNKKDAIKVHTSTNFLTDKNEICLFKNRIIERMQKNNNLLEDLSKKYSSGHFSGNMFGNMTERNYRNNKDRVLINLKSKNKVFNSLRKNNINYGDNKIYINRNSNSYSKKSCKAVLTHNKNKNYNTLCYLYEKPKKNYLKNCMIVNNNTKKVLNINDNKKLFEEDPLAYKIFKISNKNKKICLTTINSLNRIKEATNLIAKNCAISNNISYKNKTIDKFNTINSINSLNLKKNLVLNQLSKKDIIYDNKKKLINQGRNSGFLTSRENSSSSSKNKHFIKFPNNDKNSGPNTFRESQKSSQKINLNLNLNIHFDIDVAKNDHKKLIFSNAVINQNQHNDGINKYSNISSEINKKNSIKSISSTIKNNYMKRVNKGIKADRLNINRIGKK